MRFASMLVATDGAQNRGMATASSGYRNIILMSSSGLAKSSINRRQKAPDESALLASFLEFLMGRRDLRASRSLRQPRRFLGRDAPACVSREHRVDRQRRYYGGCGVLSCFMNCAMRFP